MNAKNLIKIICAVSIMTIVFGTVCFADIFSGGRNSGAIKAYYDSSVSSYGYTPHYDAGFASWNGISSKVVISKTTSTSNYPDKYYVGTTSVAGLAGRITPYKKNALGQIVEATVSDTWTYCTVVLYHNTFVSYGSPSIEIKSVASHEVGHTLSMAHPAIITVAVMNQGRNWFLTQDYDKTELKRKWGY